MNDKPKSIWKKSFTGRMALVIWLAVALFTVMLGSFVIALLNYNWPITIRILAGVILAACLILIYIVWLLLRWLFWKHWKRTFFACACLATLIALFYAEEDWRGKHDWEKFKRQWEAKGERFDMASVIPPSVPDDQNFAMAPIFDAVDKSMSQKWRTEHKNPHFGQGGDWMPWDTNIVDRLDMSLTDNSEQQPANGIGNWQAARMSNLKAWQNYYHTLAAKTNLFPVASRPQTPAQDVLLALSKYDSTIEALREASRRPDSRFLLDYDDENPAEILLPHLSDLKRCALVLQLRALAELQDGQNNRALADVKLMLYLANSIRTEPILISHLVRIAIVNIALQPIWEGLAEHQWSDAQLIELNSELGKLDFLSGYRTAMRGEMVLCQGGIFDYLRHHPEQLPSLFAMSDNGDSSPPVPSRIGAWLIPRGWLYQNQLHCARPMVEFYLPAADVSHRIVSPCVTREGNAFIAADTRNSNPYNLLERMLMPALSPAIKKFAFGQAFVDMARTACALERYRLANGKYPESLDALTPRFMEKIPHDIIGGRPSQGSGPASQPLHYRRTSDGQFVLYSIGWNETDDGGKVVLYKGPSSYVDISQGDWVWRYPAR